MIESCVVKIRPSYLKNDVFRYRLARKCDIHLVIKNNAEFISIIIIIIIMFIGSALHQIKYALSA